MSDPSLSDIRRLFVTLSPFLAELNQQNQVIKRNIMNLESDIETNNSEVASEREEKSKLEERIRSLKLDLGKLTPTPVTPQQNGWGFTQTDSAGFGNGFGSPATNQDPFGSANPDPFASSSGQTQDPFGQSGFGNFGASSGATPTDAFGANANGWGES